MQPYQEGSIEKMQRFSGEVVACEPERITVRWDEPELGGPPPEFEIAKVRGEPRKWWDDPLGAKPTTTAE
eukprot:gene11980-4265_t